MPKFFHGWRRKLGCLTLLLACVFAVGWVRSPFIQDAIHIPCDDGDYFCEIGQQRISFIRVPYWSIVIPMTLLSAYLLLSKPWPIKPSSNLEGSP